MTRARTSARRDSRPAPRLVFLISAVVTIVFLISYVFSDRGISQLHRAQQRVQQLQENVDSLQAENRHLVDQLETLDRSTFPIERIAREDLGMARPGETIYLLSPEVADESEVRTERLP